MNIYQYKRTWKIALSIVAVILFAASWWYTNLIVQHISNRERSRVTAWAQEIKKKAQLVQYTDDLFITIRKEEKKKGELWAKGVKKLISTNDPNADYDFLFDVVRNNETVPVILTDENHKITNHRNLEFEEKDISPKILEEELKQMQSLYPPILIRLPNGKQNFLYYKDSKIFTELKKILDEMNSTFISEVILNSASVPVLITDSTKEKIINYGFIDEVKPPEVSTESFIYELLEELRSGNLKPIEIELKAGETSYIYYQESFIVQQLEYFPFIQLTIVLTFIFIGYFLFNTFRREEQNQVWVGMSKETAHQLGTPISSMMAWLEILKAKYPEEQTLIEFDNDIKRLEIVADRFSKIGSHAKLEKIELHSFIQSTLDYLRKRLSQQVTIELHEGTDNLITHLSPPLFSWVIENLTKNAVDAMSGKGTLDIYLTLDNKEIHIDFKDSGKGIAKSQFKRVFNLV